MAKTKKRADGLIERCRVIDGKTRHFYGRTAKEVQAKLDAALIEASTRQNASARSQRRSGAPRSRASSMAPAGATAIRWSSPRAGLRGRACARSPAPTSTAS